MDGGEAEVPLGSAADQVAHNLVAPTTSLIGRERELAHVAALLSQDRLVSLVGPAGIGKTRLALHSAIQRLEEEATATWFVDLSLVTQPDLVVQALASASRTRQRPGQALLQTVSTRLSDGAQLVVLDNCEHLLHACADLVCRLLRSCPDLRVLATSREALGVVGEVVWRVPPLGPPRGESPAEVATSDAARLFLARIKADVELGEGSVTAVGRICRRLDGVPLAIELAAGRVGELTPEEVEANLGQRFELLATRDGAGSERQRSFQGALAWSHDLLSEPERALLRRVAVFAGPFNASAAVQVCALHRVGGDGMAAVVARLAAKSLLVEQRDDGQLTYRMHESLRHFAREKLRAAGEDVAIHSAHARWCAAVVGQADVDTGEADQVASLATLVEIHPELRAALAWAVEHDPELALALAGGLTRCFWVAHAHLDEARGWLERALAAGPPSSRARAKALWGFGLVACLLGDFAAVGPAVEEGLVLARQYGDGKVIARLLNLVGVTRVFTDPPGAVDVLEEAIALARRHEEAGTLVGSLAMLGFARALCAQFEDAAESLEECLARGAGLGDNQPLVMGLVGLGHVRVNLGDPDGGRDSLVAGLAMARSAGNPIWVALALAYLAELETSLGRHGQARRWAEEAVDVARQTGAAPVIGLCLAVAGNAMLGDGDPSRSVPLFDEALSLCASGERGGVRARALTGRGRAHLELGDPDAARVLFEEAVTLAEHGRNVVAAADAARWLELVGEASTASVSPRAS